MMNVVIFSDCSHSFVKPLAEGLANSFRKIGWNTAEYENGLYWLQGTSLVKVLFLDIVKLFANTLAWNRNLYVYRFWAMVSFWTNKRRKEVASADCIVVVCQSPTAFYRDNLARLEWLRENYPDIPVVLYESKYLPNQGWYSRIKRHPEGYYGLERFDWYLCGSLGNEFAFPRDLPKIYSLIGINLQHKTLCPEQKDFRALVDFPRKGYEAEREVQIAALEEAGVPYVELKGRYTIDEIRSIYRRTSIYFVSCRESFCLPVVEIQLCGGLIFAPYSRWLPAYFIGKDIYSAGNGKLGKNFHVYENDKAKLVKIITECKKNFNAENNIKTFAKDYPIFYEQDFQELNSFSDLISSRHITAQSHTGYPELNKWISLDDDALSVK